MLAAWLGESDGEDSTDKAMAVLSTMVGAMVLSRAVNSKRLSKDLLQAAAKDVLARSSNGDRQPVT
jgi:TetR/AcrR family transcriptional repressor of nem operon